MFDEKRWKRTFIQNEISKYIPCPNCHQYKLNVGEKNLKYSETRESSESRIEYGGSPFADYLFSVSGCCRRCREAVTLCGTASEEERQEQVSEEEYEQYMVSTITPLFIYPPPHLFSIPSNCPETVKKALISVFALYWCDIDACAGRLRTVVELMLDAEGVPGRTDNDKPIFLSTRLKAFEQKNAPIAKMLEAPRLLGNESTHELGVKTKEVDTALRIVSHALWVLYQNRQVLELAEKMIEEKDPKKKKEKKKKEK